MAFRQHKCQQRSEGLRPNAGPPYTSCPSRTYLLQWAVSSLKVPRKDLAHDLTQLHHAEETSERGVHWRKHMSLHASKWMGCNVVRDAHGTACTRQRLGKNAPLAVLSIGSSSCLFSTHSTAQYIIAHERCKPHESFVDTHPKHDVLLAEI